MIVDLNLEDKLVLVIGGGKEAEKRINSLIKQKCSILVLSEDIGPKINQLAKDKKIKFKKQKIQDSKFISKLRPDMIITTTNDEKLNRKILKEAKKRKIITYSADNPDNSDFSNPAVIDIKNTVQVAIFTGGRSPIMSKRIKNKAQKALETIVTKQDIQQIKIQKIARDLAKKEIPTQIRRKEYLNAITNDNKIDQLIKDNQMRKAEKRAVTILRDWK